MAGETRFELSIYSSRVLEKDGEAPPIVEEHVRTVAVDIAVSAEQTDGEESPHAVWKLPEVLWVY